MKLRYIITAAALVSLVACNDDEVFEKEQYKNVFGFVSESDNTNTKVVSLHKEESVGYMSLSMGGSNPIKRDVTVNIVEDESLIDAYNSANFDTDVSKYAIHMPKSKYDIVSYKCVIKAGESLGTIPVNIRPEGLSPDSTYFIPVRIDNYDGCEMNPDKGTLLLKVAFKNRWAASTGTGYSMLGKRRNVTSTTEISMPGTKTVHAYGHNSVRVMPGNETFKADKHTLEAKAMILEIEDTPDEVKKVTIKPVRDLKVTQIDGDKFYPNTYAIVDDGFNVYKMFLLHYYYTIGNNTYEMKEELRIRYIESEENEE